VQALIPAETSAYSDISKMVYKTTTNLTINSVTVSGTTVKVKATLTDGSSNPLGGKTITFYDKTGTASYVSKGTATTASTTSTTPGAAFKNWALTSGSHLMKATFAGNSQLAPSTSAEVPYP
jgi:hypothetical protein